MKKNIKQETKQLIIGIIMIFLLTIISIILFNETSLRLTGIAIILLAILIKIFVIDKLYKKCIIRFGKPIIIDLNEPLSIQSQKIKEAMSETRKQIWKEYGISRLAMSDVDPTLYVNHTYAKKFKALGFTYDSQEEQKYLLFLEGEKPENEYTINPNGEFEAGITEKNTKLRKILK